MRKQRTYPEAVEHLPGPTGDQRVFRLRYGLGLQCCIRPLNDGLMLPPQKDQRCIPIVSWEFVCRMEDVLDFSPMPATPP